VGSLLGSEEHTTPQAKMLRFPATNTGTPRPKMPGKTPSAKKRGSIAGEMTRVYIGDDLQGPRKKPSQRRNGGETMKSTRGFVLAVSLLAALVRPGRAMAQSAFDGTGKLDLKTAKFP